MILVFDPERRYPIRRKPVQRGAKYMGWENFAIFDWNRRQLAGAGAYCCGHLHVQLVMSYRNAAIKSKEQQAVREAATICPRPCLSDVSDVCLSRTSGLSREQIERPGQNWHRGSPRHAWLGHHFQGQKVKGHGHRAALLTVALTRQTAQRWAWERIGRGNLLLRCGLQTRRREALGAHRGRIGAGHIVAAARLQLVLYWIEMSQSCDISIQRHDIFAYHDLPLTVVNKNYGKKVSNIKQPSFGMD